ncbi:MAG: citrate transporter [Treponema sp.]|nr:citrate transporter [Candidatus Treponema caballi]
MKKVVSFIKKEPVLCAALILALFAVIFVKPGVSQVTGAIDFRVLSLLFSLMAIIQAFRSVNVLDAFAAFVLKACHTVRSLFLSLTALVFFSSMAVTNDVALLTFVPITLITCRKARLSEKQIVLLIVIETLAANLGSCVTPMGNPQNLFLFSYYNMDGGQFFLETLKIGVPSLILLVALILVLTRRTVSLTTGAASPISPVRSPWRTIVYTATLITILLSVFRVLDYKVSLAVTVIVLAVCNWRLFAKVDYSLLLTFTGFFIFTGTISSVPAVSETLSRLLKTPLSSYITAIAASQIISNVPAALLLSGFTENAQALLLGVNVGGLGTLIASLASVISFKLYAADHERVLAAASTAEIAPSDKSEKKDSVSYFAVFSLMNVLFLVVLGILVWLL